MSSPDDLLNQIRSQVSHDNDKNTDEKKFRLKITFLDDEPSSDHRKFKALGRDEKSGIAFTLGTTYAQKKDGGFIQWDFNPADSNPYPVLGKQAELLREAFESEKSEDPDS